jgi:release factor glutamine methyltransferase
LLAGTLGLRRLDLYLQFERILTADELATFKERLRRRLRHEPIQYIAGTAEFRELELKVDSRVLIPRPETEILVGEVLAWAADKTDLDVVDIGTGSGAIALSLRKEGTFRRVVAVDVSEAALEVSRLNGEQVLSAGEVDFRQGSLFEPLRGEEFDVVVSNPPYVSEGDRDALAEEVVQWEPPEALFAGEDGLGVIRRLVAEAPASLRPGGLLALEIGATQGAEVAALVGRSPSFRDAVCKKDYSGRDRIILAEKRS